MLLLDQLAEQKILDAVAQGVLDDLPGAGAPLDLEDDALVPEDLRAGYRLLKNAGFIPPEMQLRNEIADVEALITGVTTQEATGTLNRRRNYLLMKLNLACPDALHFNDTYYRQKLINKDQ